MEYHQGSMVMQQVLHWCHNSRIQGWVWRFQNRLWIYFVLEVVTESFYANVFFK